MQVYEWILPSLSEVLAWSQWSEADWTITGEPECAGKNQGVKAEREWRLAIAAVEQLLLRTLEPENSAVTQGLVLAGPVPVFSQPIIMNSLQTVTFTAKPFNALALMPFPLPENATKLTEIAPPEPVLPLLVEDPLAKEQFCLVLTAKFACILVLGKDSNGIPKFSFSFEPEVVEQAWRALGARMVLTHPHLLTEVDTLVKQYAPVAPDYRLVMQFSQLLLKEIPAENGNREAEKVSTPPATPASSPCASSSPRPDVELLQAFAHEVRTPLTTIRMITKLLLKRRDLPAEAVKRLQAIDRECTEQIDRMELLFRAAELETCKATKNNGTHLTAMPLEQVLQQSIPRWQSSAMRRNLTLDVVLPQKLPSVVSNPTMLDQMLTGLIENFTRSLPAGSHIQVQVIPAGDQLKLQLLPHEPADSDKAVKFSHHQPLRKSLGQLLTFQPETGTISLNLAATKHLFQTIGGKLTVRQRPDQGEVLTVYLPLDGNKQK